MRSDLSPAGRGEEAPLPASQRIEALDVLRGLALAGVIVIHAVFEFRVSIFQQFLPDTGNLPPLERALQSFLAAAVELKAFALFSLLFGAGLAIQFDRLAGNPRRMVLLVRRLAVLLGLGAVHLVLIWNGDILVEYALAGLVVLPLLFGPRWLALAVATASLTVFIAMPLLPPVAFPADPWIRSHIAEAVRVYGGGGFSDVLAFRISEIPAMFPLHVLIFPRTVALFLFGALAWRAGLLRELPQRRGVLCATAIAGIVCGGALTLAATAGIPFAFRFFARSGDVAERLGSIVLVAGYAAAVLAIMTMPAGKKLLGWAAPVGRMAFSNYLAQSLILSFIFYGYGLGLFGRVGVTAALAIALAVYAAQAAASAWWLKRWRYGPVEWLWRSLMYGQPQPMRPDPPAGQP
ncbi:MAG: uncharacterized protein QOH32_2238 [Bradyrhizobium sp.]|jgi:uncharacterized protein|nr:uncharacterized protein [Bradyrhizobium sp.]